MKTNVYFAGVMATLTLTSSLVFHPLNTSKGIAEIQVKTPSTELAQNIKLTELVEDESDLRLFLQLVKVAGLLDTLSGSKSYTIFAPTNEAIEALPKEVRDQLLRPENRTLLRDILSYHIVSGSKTSTQLKTGGLTSLNGGLAVRVTNDAVFINGGSVTEADLKASNGVVHKVNRVMLSEALQSRVASLTRVRGLW